MSSLAERLQSKQQKDMDYLDQLAEKNLQRLELSLAERLKDVLNTTGNATEKDIANLREQIKNAILPITEDMKEITEVSESVRLGLETVETQARKTLVWCGVRMTIVAMAALLIICVGTWGMTQYFGNQLISQHKRLQQIRGTRLVTFGGQTYLVVPNEAEIVTFEDGQTGIRLN